MRLILMTAALAMVSTSSQSAPPLPEQAGALIGPALHVSDLKRSLHFYIDGLGMQNAMQMGPAERRETILTFGGDPRNPGIILLSDESGKTASALVLGNGYDRTVMRMPDLAATEKRLHAAGFATTPIRHVAHDYSVMMATDPDGYRYELVQSGSSPDDGSS